uniref:KIB1-4 beta-propeller domain-containing protein n=1 Tax=Oryza punctata TaxID=4537 RepID=A0A0E0JZ31_ORYPU
MADANNQTWRARSSPKNASSASSATSCILDHAMFSSVCKPWRSIALLQQQQPPSNLPWLLMPSNAATSFFCVVSEDTHRPGLPGDARGARFCGSFPGAWLAAELAESRGPTLLNLCTGERVALPRRLRFNDGFRGSKHVPHHLPRLHPLHGAVGRSPILRRGRSIQPVQHRLLAPRHGLLDATDEEAEREAKRMASQSWTSHTAPTGRSARASMSSPTRTTYCCTSQKPQITTSEFRGHVQYSADSRAGRMVAPHPRCSTSAPARMCTDLTNKEYLLVYTPNTSVSDDHAELTISSVEVYCGNNHRPIMPGPGKVLARCFVHSCGELLMVIRFVSAREGRTTMFDAFRLERRRAAANAIGLVKVVCHLLKRKPG